MVKKLTKLVINEISSVDRGAGENCKIVLMKRDNKANDDPPFLFNDIMAKAAVSDELRGPRDEPDDMKLSAKLDELVAEMIVARPSLHPNRARRWLLETPHGRELLAQHKKETPMPQVDIMKLHNPDSVIEFIKSSGASEFVISEVIMGHAKLNKRDGESDAQAFARVFPRFQIAYGVAKGYPDVTRTTPVSVEVGDTSVADDSWKASEQLAALMEEQRSRAPWMTASRAWEAIYADPANKALVARAHKRPTASSTSGDELQR
jgi:hypothetical protein